MSHDQYQTGIARPATARPRPTQPRPAQPGPRPRGPRPVRKTRPSARRGPVLLGVVSVVAAIGLFLFGVAAESVSRKGTAAAISAAAGQPKAAAPAKGSGSANGTATRQGLGKAVRDGKFEFVVSAADCSKSSVGLPHLSRTAAGRYCVVSLTVKNIAGNPQLFLGSAQKVIDAAGAKYSDDEIAGIYANHDTQTFLRKIDPGHKVVGKIVFDVPKAATVTTVELHDSYFSDGVKVALR